jgi:hypothetical protein
LHPATPGKLSTQTGKSTNLQAWWFRFLVRIVIYSFLLCPDWLWGPSATDITGYFCRGKTVEMMYLDVYKAKRLIKTGPVVNQRAKSHRLLWYQLFTFSRNSMVQSPLISWWLFSWPSNYLLLHSPWRFITIFKNISTKEPCSWASSTHSTPYHISLRSFFSKLFPLNLLPPFRFSIRIFYAFYFPSHHPLFNHPKKNIYTYDIKYILCSSTSCNFLQAWISLSGLGSSVHLGNLFSNPQYTECPRGHCTPSILIYFIIPVFHLIQHICVGAFMVSKEFETLPHPFWSFLWHLKSWRHH